MRKKKKKKKKKMALSEFLQVDFVLQVLVSSFLAILFVQSGLDKVVDRAGNLEYVRGHFAKSPLAPFTALLLTGLTALELAAGLLSAVGVAVLLSGGTSLAAYLGSIFSGLSFLALLFGQRLAKDYAGAAALAPYFVVALAGVYINRLH